MSFDIDELIQRMGPPAFRGAPRKLVNEERDKVMAELHGRGYSYRRIGKAFGITTTSVFYALKRLRERST